MPKSNLRFLLYTLHAHLGNDAPVNYAALFKKLVDLKETLVEERNKYIAIGSAKLLGEKLSLIVYAGIKDKTVLYFDLREKTEITSLNLPRRFPARKTHLLMDPTQRLALIETGRGRIDVENIEHVIEERAHQLDEYKTLDLSFTPVAAKEFIEQLDSMERIQSATVSIIRPNFDWTDSYNALTKLADESNGKAIDATIRSKRGGGISKKNGIIPNLKAWLAEAKSSVFSARIKGEKASKSGLITLRLSDHVESVSIPVETNIETGQPVEDLVEEQLSSHLDLKARQSSAETTSAIRKK